MTFSLAQQIEEVDREIALRVQVYPRQVSARKMTQSVADYHLERMRAVRTTLVWMRDKETEIREFVSSKGERKHGDANDAIRETDGAGEGGTTI